MNIQYKQIIYNLNDESTHEGIYFNKRHISTITFQADRVPEIGEIINMIDTNGEGLSGTVKEIYTDINLAIVNTTIYVVILQLD